MKRHHFCQFFLHEALFTFVTSQTYSAIIKICEKKNYRIDDAFKHNISFNPQGLSEMFLMSFQFDTDTSYT